MRKFLTFFIVLIIQLSIIYGLYCWYVSDHEESAKPDKKTTTEIQKEITAKKLEPVKKTEKIEQSPKAEKKIVSATPTSEPTVSRTGEMKTDNTITVNASKPLMYKYTDWGDISSLPDCKLTKTGILVNINTRRVLWAKNCRKSVPIASMTKMMTALIAFETIQNDPDINLNTVVQVTKEAYKIGGSQVWLDPRESFTLKELLKTVMIKSANDSAYLIAQYLGGGDIASFIAKMNTTAKEIGMPNAHFSNPDGLPEKYASEDNRATAEGLAFLAEHLMKYPLAVKWASTRIDYFRENSKNPTMLVNTNGLVRKNVTGVNGMKTGYTSRAGFCLTCTCTRGGKTLVGVVTGFKSSKARDKYMQELLSWGFKKDARIK